MDSIFKPAFILMVGRALGFAVNFLTPMVIVRVFNQPEFGTYKQVFLLHATFFGIAQIGMSEGLYYFLPSDPEKTARYLTNSFAALSISGLCALAVLQLSSAPISDWLNNPALPPHIPLLGFYLWLTLMSTPLEIALVARQRYLQASAVYASSDIARTILMVVPALLGWGLQGILWGAILAGFARVCATIIFAVGDFGSDLRLDFRVFRRQVAYALPFAMWVISEMASTTLPQYLIAHNFDAATFAIFSVGCLQVPLVDFVLTSAGTVMMVKIGAALHERKTSVVIGLWHETNRKLALVFVPLVILLVLLARELIVFLFTESYLASVPLFMLWSVMILLAALPTEGVLRTYADSGALFLFSTIRLLIIATGCSFWGLRTLGPIGVILVTLSAAIVYKVLGLYRLKYLAQISLTKLVPWANITTITGCALAASLPTWLIKSCLKVSPAPLIVVTGILYLCFYVALAHRFGLINVRALLDRAFRSLNYRSVNLASADPEVQ